jgi:hypothetical protein
LGTGLVDFPLSAPTILNERIEMKNIKVELAPPYRADEATYVSKVSASVEFDNEVMALNFTRELNLLIIRFTDKHNAKPALAIVKE